MDEPPVDDLQRRAVRVFPGDIQPVQGNRGARGKHLVVDIRAQVDEIGFVGPVVLRVDEKGGISDLALQVGADHDRQREIAERAEAKNAEDGELIVMGHHADTLSTNPQG